MKPAAFDYVRPADLGDAIRLLAGTSDAKVLAGGQSLGPMLNLRVVYPELLVDVSRLPELREIAEARDELRLGAGVTHADIEDEAVPDVTRGMMRFVAGNIAYRAVRNRGTIGGSLVHADPAADWMAAMTALGARLEIAGADRTREASLPAFMTAPLETTLEAGEVLRSVRIPRLSTGARWGYYKLCRKAGEFAHAIGAVVIDPGAKLRRAVLGANGGPPVLFDDTDPDVDELLGNDAERSFAAAGRLMLARKVTGDGISRQLYSVALARAAAMARQMQ